MAKIKHFSVLALLGPLFSALLAFTYWPKNNNKEISKPRSLLQSRSCPYDPISGHNLKCFWFFTDDGFKLPVAVFHSDLNPHNAKGLVVLPGGPGDGGNTGYDALRRWDFWLSEGIITHDLVLFDYRGLGPGFPLINCSEYQHEANALLKRSVSVEEENRLLLPGLTECIERLETVYPNAISSINSRSNANDVLALMDALSYKSITPLAVSYGTRVALQMLDDPKVESLVLDSLYSLEQDSLINIVTDWNTAFESFWSGCANLPNCEAPALKAAFFSVFDQLKQSTITVRSTNWQTSLVNQWQLTDQRFLFAAFNALYVDFKRSELIDYLKAVQSGSLPEEHAFLEYFYNNIVNNDFNAFVYLLTQCNDLGPTNSEELPNLSEEERFWFDLLQSAMVENKTCQLPFFKPTALLEPESSKPVLIVAGQHDPVTPQKYSYHYHNRLANSQLIVLPDAGHGEFIQGPCSANIVSNFLSSGTERTSRVGKLKHSTCKLTWQ